jgi:hypothetical protein
MNKIETIIAALEFASDNSDKANFQYHIVEKALAAARELRDNYVCLEKLSNLVDDVDIDFFGEVTK